jgi:hypothetical protein
VVVVDSRDRDVRKLQGDESFECDFVGNLTREESVFVGKAKNELVNEVTPYW